MGHTTVSVAGLGGGFGAAWATEGVVPRLYEGTGAHPRMSATKGVIGEDLMQRMIGSGVLGETRWSAATPVGAPHGIDGLFFRLDARGLPRDMLVMEAKVFSSRLGRGARVGDQMGSSWIKHYLKVSGAEYGRLADAVQAGGVTVSSPPPGAKTYEVPLGDSSVQIWQAGDRVFVADPEAVSPQRVARQLRHLAVWMEKGATGDVSFRARVFRYDVHDGQHRFRFRTIDPETLELGREQVVMGHFDELPAEYRAALRKSLLAAFAALDLAEDEAAELVDRACQDPEFLRTMSRSPRLRLGLLDGLRLVGSAAISGFVAAVLNAGLQWWTQGEVDWRRVATAGGLASLSVLISAPAGGYSAAALLATPAGRSLLATLPGSAHTMWARSLGASGGALAAIAVVVSIQLALGLIDRETAGRQLVSAAGGIAASAAVTGGFFFAAAAFGTAGTGTAIGSLGGAVFTKTALAWIGGGPIYAGGGGAALGGAIVTGGALVVMVAAGFAFKKIWKEIDDTRRQRLIQGRLEFARERLS